MTTISHALRTAALAGLLSPFAALPVTAQVTAPMPPMPPMPPDAPMAPRIVFNGLSIGQRAYLGITPRSSDGPADTLGILVDDVEAGLPAAKAGISRGARLVSIDGVDLRLDPRDIGDPSAEALPESRLRRQLGRKEPGDTVSLVVLTDGRKDTRRVVLGESPMARAFPALARGRRVLGLSFSSRGSMRDTAGLLVISVTGGGPADKAGINEGDRLVSIDGVDLRVPAADAGTPDGVDARISRLRRALDAARDSQAVKLDVLADGRHRTVSIVPTRAQIFTFSSGDMQGLRAMADGIRYSVRSSIDRYDDDRSEAARERAEAMRERAQEQRERMQERAEAQREMAQAQREMMREQRDAMRESDRSWSRDGDWDGPARGTMRGRTDGATLTLGGLSLATVDRDFAQQFGRGSENGALIVRIRGDWDPLKAGDVILSVDGRNVRDGTTLDLSLDRRKDQKFEILRNGRKETITVPASR
jgi:S1-C subfamily serine protease